MANNKEMSVAKRFAIVAGLTAATAAVPFVAAKVMVPDVNLAQATQIVMAHGEQNEAVARTQAQRLLEIRNERLSQDKTVSGAAWGAMGLAIGLAFTSRRRNDKPQP